MNITSRETVSTRLSFNNEDDDWEENKHDNFLSKAITQIDVATEFFHSWIKVHIYLLILLLFSTYPTEVRNFRAWDIHQQNRKVLLTYMQNMN